MLHECINVKNGMLKVPLVLCSMHVQYCNEWCMWHQECNVTKNIILCAGFRQTVIHEISCWQSWLYCNWSPLILRILMPFTSFSSDSHTLSSIWTPPGYSKLSPLPFTSSVEKINPFGGALASIICFTRPNIASEFNLLDSSDNVTSTSVGIDVFNGLPMPRVILGLDGSHGSEMMKLGRGL